MRQGFRSLMLLSVLVACFAAVGCGGPERAPEATEAMDPSAYSQLGQDAEATSGADAKSGSDAKSTP